MKLIVALLFISIVFSQHNHPLYFDQIDLQVQSREISQSEAIFQKFKYVFDQSLRKSDDVIKCLTPLIREYRNNQSQMSQDAINYIESKISRQKKKSDFSYMSPSGLFSINYDTLGNDAVSTVDLNTNSIPDYVENLGSYFDFSFTHTVTNGAFKNPILNGQIYQVFVENLGFGFYGYADNDNSGLTTYIGIHNSFIGFPPNTDPDGNELGAAKVTAAHEFKHAVQYATDLIQWNNSGESWLELDATWAEEFVYDNVNDYYNYLTSNSCQIRNPSLRMNDINNSGSYFDVIWDLYLSQTHGNQFLNQFWVRRELQNGEAILTTYSNILQQFGSNMAKAIREYTSWNFMTGSRASNSYGYEEASFYPSSTLEETISSTANTDFSGIVVPFSSRHYQLDINQNLFPIIELTADPNLELSVLVETISGTVSTYRLTGSMKQHINISLNDIKTLGILPIATITSGSFLNYDFKLSYSESADFGTSIFSLGKSSVKGSLIINHDAIQNGTKTNYTIYNLLGQLIKSGSLAINTNSTEIIYPKNLARGIYFIRIQIAEQIDAQRFVTF